MFDCLQLLCRELRETEKELGLKGCHGHPLGNRQHKRLKARAEGCQSCRGGRLAGRREARVTLRQQESRSGEDVRDVWRTDVPLATTEGLVVRLGAFVPRCQITISCGVKGVVPRPLRGVFGHLLIREQSPFNPHARLRSCPGGPDRDGCRRQSQDFPVQGAEKIVQVIKQGLP